MLLKFKKSPEPRQQMATTLRQDLEGKTVPSLSETIQQPALAREVAVKIAGSVLGERHESTLKQLDHLRKTRAARGGVGAPLIVPAHLQSEPELYNPAGYRIGRSRADGDVSE